MRYAARVVAAAVLAVPLAGRASALDRVVMKDGTVVEGEILKTRFLQVFITTAEGSRTIPMSDVERIERNVQPGSAAAPIDRAAHDGEWAVRLTPAAGNRLKNTTQPYDDAITIRNGMLTTKVGTRYGFSPARCRFTPRGAATVVVAELGNPAHGTSLYTLVLEGDTLNGTLDWGKLGEDGTPKRARFTIAGTSLRPRAKSATAERSPARTAPPVPSAPPRAKAREYTPEERAKRDAAIAALRSAIAAHVTAGARPRASFRLGATSIRGTVTAADADRITVRSPMGEMSLAWGGVSIEEVIAVARACEVDAKLVRAAESMR